MGFQSVVNLTQGAGVQGDIFYKGPMRAAPWELVSSPHPNVIGATAYTVVIGQSDDTQSGQAMAGGAGEFAGILINSKVYANFSASLAASLTLPDHTIGELLTMGQILALLPNATNPGDPIIYDSTTGALSSVPSSVAFTASFATNQMTVTVAPTVGTIGIGSVISAAGVAPGTVVVSGTGPYTLSTTPGTIAAEAVTASGFAGTGKLFVPRAKTIMRPSAAAGLAIIQLTN